MPESTALAAILARRATGNGCLESNGYPGVHFYRATEPGPFRKLRFHGSRLIVVAQGRKVAHVHGQTLAYDGQHYLVMTGETEVYGHVVEASVERPYLALCLDLPAELVAKNLLAFADTAPPENAPVTTELGATALAASPSGALAYVSELDASITDAVTRLLSAFDDSLDRRVLAPLAMEELVFRLLRTPAAGIVRSAVQAGDDSIREAMRYMREQAHGALTVEQVARHVGMSASHFAHRFSAVARTSPMRFLKQLRLEAARELMVLNRLRVEEAALRVGYESTSHFNRDFKAAFGAAPASYARQMRDG